MAKSPKGATRHQPQEQKSSLNLHWVLALVLLPAGIVALVWGTTRLLDPATLPVKTVRVENALKHLDQATVRRTVLPHVKEGFLRVDVAVIRQELEALPWVAEASVRRSWPDMLVVRVREQQAAARWSEGGLLNPEGELFMAQDAQQWHQLALLRGPKRMGQAVMEEYQAMQGMLTPLKLKITHLTMSDRRAWSMRLDNGLQLRLGRNESRVRLLRFVRVYSSVLHPKLQDIDSVDLRYTNGFAVRWRDGQAAA